MEENDLTIEIKNPKVILVSILLVAILYLQLQITVGSPISFGDEGFHTRMAEWIAENVEYPVWVPFVQTNLWKTSYSRQPFWNILEAGFFFVFGSNEIIPKILTPVISLATGIVTYIIGKKFYNENVGLVSSIILIGIPSFVTYSVLFYTDMLVTFFTTMFLLFLMIAMRSERKLYMMAAGTFAALVFMTKLTGYSVYVAFALIMIYEMTRKKKVTDSIKKYFPALIMMFLIPSTFFLRTYSYYKTPICYGIPIISPITDRLFNLDGCSFNEDEQEYNYEGRTQQTGSEAGVFNLGLMSYIEFAYGNPWFISLTFFSGLLVIWNRIKHSEIVRQTDFTLISMIIVFLVLFTAITKRSEDTARFSLMWAPVISIIAAQYVSSLYNFVKAYQKHVALIVFIFVLYFSVFSKSGLLNKLGTMYQVKQFVPSFFEACEWIEENTEKDAVISTIWTYRTAYCSKRTVTGSEPDMALS
ncbi:MAG: ArnT family glycosyltransferase, partial [Candidatus Hodarchaeales archaeon]